MMVFLLSLANLVCFVGVFCDYSVPAKDINDPSRATTSSIEKIIVEPALTKTGVTRMTQDGKVNSHHGVFRSVPNQRQNLNVKHNKFRRTRKSVRPRSVDDGEDDWNPYADVDQTDEYDQIEETKNLEKQLTKQEIDELTEKQMELEAAVKQVEVKSNLHQKAKEMEEAKTRALEGRLLKEMVLNKAQGRMLKEETAKRMKAEAQNLENMKTIVELQAKIQHLRVNLGDEELDCSVMPCANGGVCLAKQPSGHECVCPDHFKGVNCQLPVDGDSNGLRFSFGATITLKEVGSEIVVIMPISLMIVLTVVQIISFLTCVLQCCLMKH